MELRPGYKNTEIGVIPEDWRIVTLESITDPRAPIRYGVVQIGSDTPNGIPIVPIKFIKEISSAPLPRSARFIEERFAGSRICAGDVLLSVKGTIGRLGIVPSHFEGNIAREIARLRIKNEESPQFIMYQLEGDHTQRRISDAVVGTTRLEFSIAAVRKFPIAVPPSQTERKAVARALSDGEDLTSALSRLIAKKHTLRQGAMQRLLTGQTRLPGFSTPWQTKRLGEIGEVAGAGVDKKSRPDEIPVRLVNYMDVYRFDAIGSSMLSHCVTAKEAQARRCSILTGDVFFTPTSETRDDIAHSAVAIEDIPDAVYSYHLVRLRLNEPWNIHFRAYAFKTKDFMDQASIASEGSGARYVITLPKFRALTVRYPADRSEQAAIARVLSDMDTEISALEARLDKARALKQAMMQALLTGRVRLPVRRDVEPHTKEAAHA